MADKTNGESKPGIHGIANPKRGSRPAEYLHIVRAVVDRFADGKPSTPTWSAATILAWLHSQELPEIQRTVKSIEVHDGSDGLLHSVVSSILKESHHPLVKDWTPDQILFWLGNIRYDDVQVCLRAD